MDVISVLYVFLILGAFCLGLIVKSYLPARLKKSGELDEINARFDEILDQSKKTTSEIENIKSQVSYAEWQKREYNSLMRSKLEDLMGMIFEINRLALKGHENIEESTFGLVSIEFHKIATISELYFDVLTSDITELSKLFFEHERLLRYKEHLIKNNPQVSQPQVGVENALKAALDKMNVQVTVISKKAKNYINVFLGSNSNSYNDKVN